MENVKLNFKAEELELQKRLAGLQTKLEKDKIIDAETAKFLDYSINVRQYFSKYFRKM